MNHCERQQLSQSGTLVERKLGGNMKYEALMQRITELENEVSILRKRADYDVLTGCLRRDAFVNLIEKRRQFGLLGRDQSLVVMDIDHFKSVNDTFGHLAGDDVLKFVAKELQDQLPHGSLLCRMGGEEFIAILPLNLASAFDHLDKMRSQIEKTSIDVRGNKSINITLSFGLVNWDSDTALIESTARADAALYRAKSSGRNQIALDEIKLSA